MVSKKMYERGNTSSVIREIFEYGKKRASEIGAENVYDFSIGNPNVPAPIELDLAIKDVINNMDSAVLHGYTSAVGDINTRQSIAEFLNKTHDTNFTYNNFYMTSGAAASLSITFNALALPDDEVIVFAPFFPEYTVFIENTGAKVVQVKCNEEDFQIDLLAFEKAITKNTKAVVLNSPNNPSGVVTSEKTIIALCEILNKKSKEFGNEIFLISDEPYRELVYDDVFVPFLTKYYNNTIVCYSYSKSLSLAGERIGYILVPNEIYDFDLVFKAICGAGRSLGFVCASSLFQFVLPKVQGLTSDISIYKKNRDILINALSEYGFSMAKPDGAFYLFMKSPDISAESFCEMAKKYELLLVPSDSFGFEGYVRISYCVSTQMIENSLSAFQKLAKHYF